MNRLPQIETSPVSASAVDSQAAITLRNSSLPAVLLLLLALLPYAGVLGNDFAYIYDDKAQILDNPYVHTFGHLREALTTPVWSFADAHTTSNYYRPVMTLGFLLCYQIFGPVAFGFHLASLVLHVAVVLLLYLLARDLFNDRGAAWAAAALFAVHPIHVESIAWISAVTDLELTFFYLLTFWIFLKLGNRKGGQELFLRLAMTAGFLLALLSKEQAVTLAVLAVIYEHFYRDDRNKTALTEKIGRYGPLWLLLIGYLIVRVRLMGSFAHPTGWVRMTAEETILSAIALFGQYLAKLVFPARLSAFYVFHPSAKFIAAPVLAGSVAVILIAFLFFVLWRLARPLSFGILWLVLTIAPVLNARWMGTYVLADRYAYLPSVGFCLVVGWAIAKAWRISSPRRSASKWLITAGSAAILTLCIAKIVTRVPTWYDDITLISRALASEPQEFILHDALGDAFWLRGEWPQAEGEWKDSLRLHPDYFRPLNALGALCAKQRRFDEAEQYFERTIALDPDNADAHLNLGGVDAEQGKMDQAETQFKLAIAITPMNVTSHNVLGKLYFDSGRLPEAEQQFRQSLAVEPNLAAFDYLGSIYSKIGNWPLAEAAFKSSLRLNGSDSRALYQLGIHAARAGNNAEAEAELKAALATDPNNAEIRAALENLSK
jgi:tetratricopeptide (TPR) repeat protein